MLALLTAASALSGGPLAGRAPRSAWWAVGLLALFVGFTGASLAWTIAPDRTWTEFNRTLSYLLVAGVAVQLGAAMPRAAGRFAAGWLLVACAVALYALGGKVAPGIVDTTAQVARLRAPLEYWNALGLLCALAAPVAVRLAVDMGRSLRARVLALEALYLLALVVGLTYSRGAVAAFLVATAVLCAVGSGRLRGVIALGAATAGAAVPLAVAFGRDGLTTNGADLAVRIRDGRLLGAAVVLGAVGLGLAAVALVRLERRVEWSAGRTRRVFRIAAVAAGVVVLVGAAGLARSQRGLPGTLDDVARGLTEVREDRQFDPVRLVSTNAGNRWSWWKEAAGAWSDRPAEGWGAGSFSLLHLRYRQDTLPVTQAHSMPMQLLAETGVVGLLLAYAAILALLAAAVARTRRLGRGRDRDLAVAFLAAAGAWLVHGLFDWDLQIPAVTAPVLVMLGLLAGRSEPRPLGDPARLTEDLARPRGRVGPVALATLVAAVVVTSAALPWFAARKADDAARTAARGAPADLERAAAQAALAARLNPLATRPLFVAAAVAGSRGRLLEARAHLLAAAERSPRDPQVWGRLARLALQLADREGYRRSVQLLFALDPLNPVAESQSAVAEQFLTPPASSATATGTPLATGAPTPVPPDG